jgi:AbrB family looped-hinge helix DNA binding protein
MDVAITKMSSKGQVVIPAEMRKNLHEGDKIVIIQHKNQLILKKATLLQENLTEDLEFARRTEEAWKRYEKGEFTRMDAKEFLKELETW